MMNRQKLLCVVLMCFGFSLVYAAAQTQPAAGPPASAPATPLPPAKASPAAMPDPQTPEEFFARARQLSDLEASGIPFHLKATYVASGDTEFTGNGTYEEWWQSKDLWRKEATLGDYKYVEIQNGEKNTVYGSSNYIPLRLRQMLKTVVIKIAPDAGTEGGWKLAKKKLNGVDLVVLSDVHPCVMMNFKMKCSSEDYFTTQGVLRIDVKGSVEIIYNGIQAFDGLQIPRIIDMAAGNVKVLTISTASLETPTPSQSELLNTAPPPNLPAMTFPIILDRRASTSVQAKAAKLLRAPQPDYPLLAKEEHLQGVVVIDATIDEAGNIREPFVIESAGSLLDRAAVEAVRKWHYQTTTLNGAPVCVNTTISVVFRM